MFFRRYIGDRAFYRKLFAVLVPILIQNVITNFVNLLDNIMVGQVGTEPMSGVAIVNQLVFVFNSARATTRAYGRASAPSSISRSAPLRSFHCFSSRRASG